MGDYKVVTATSASQLTEKVRHLMVTEEWKPVGGHQAVELHHQNQFAGSSHRATVIKVEYSQTLIK